MGDFNDEPFDRSLREYANSTGSEKVVLSSRTVPRLFNLMWPLLGRSEGSYFHGSAPMMLDQILVSRGLLTGEAGIKICKESIEVVRCPSMMNKNGTPRRFGRPTSGMDLTGASDHLPVGVNCS